MADEEGDDKPKIPEALVTRIMHEFFSKENTRMSKDANAAVTKYLEIFVGEALARVMVESKGTFLDVSHVELGNCSNLLIFWNVVGILVANSRHRFKI